MFSLHTFEVIELTRRRPNETFRLVIREIRKGPKYPREIAQSQQLSERAVDACIKRGKSLEIFKSLQDKRTAWIDYSPLEDRIIQVIKDHREQHPTLRDLEISDVAARVGKAPDSSEFKDAFWSAAAKTKWNVDSTKGTLF